MGQARREGIRDNLTLELRRGALVLAVLAALQEEQYGYSLKTYLAGKDVDIDEGTLYPLLRRLEAQSLLDSRWALGENRPRRYAKLNAQGMRTLRELKGEWRRSRARWTSCSGTPVTEMSASAREHRTTLADRGHDMDLIDRYVVDVARHLPVHRLTRRHPVSLAARFPRLPVKKEKPPCVPVLAALEFRPAALAPVRPPSCGRATN